MIRGRWLGRWLWLAAGLAALGGLAWAQGPKSSPARGPAANETDAADLPGQNAAKKATKKLEDLPPVAAQDPAVDAVLATKPATPSELIRAGKALADLRRPDLAREHFRRALAAGLDPKSLAALADEFGSATFSAIALRRDLAPEGKQLADAVLGAKLQELQDPQRVEKLVQDLADPSPEVRALAVVGLQDAGYAAVGPLLAALSDPGRPAAQAGARAALAAMGSAVQGPLTAALDASDPKLVVEAIQLLAASRAVWPSYFLLRPCCDEKAHPDVRAAAQAAARCIWRRVPNREEASRLLAGLALRCAHREEPLEADESGQVLLWHWDEAKKQVLSRVCGQEEAARWFAARFARDAHAVLPDRTDLLWLHLATMLEQSAREAGRDQPLAMTGDSPLGKLAAMGEDAVEQVLVFAMEHGQTAAAAAAARLLGTMPGFERLLTRAARPCPLVLAARHPDRRLRFAAVEAIMHAKPRGPYPGASYVSEAIQFMAASHGVKRVLVASPRREESMRLAGLLARLGYQTEIAATGREIIRKALDSPDYEIVLIDAIVSYPTVNEVLQSLRRDGRTSLLPVGVLAAAGDLERASHLVRHDTRSEAFSRPHDFPTVKRQIERLVALGGDLLSAEERKRQAGMALDWLAAGVRSPNGWVDGWRVEPTMVAALGTPGLTAKACAALGNLGTPRAQEALVDLASRKTTPLADRKAALDAFRTAVEQRGILLTTAKIQLQYDRYNQSADEDPATQAVLGGILDCLEAPTRPLNQASNGMESTVPRMTQGDEQPKS
jgi:CheY-like chemotaxis protein